MVYFMFHISLFIIVFPLILIAHAFMLMRMVRSIALNENIQCHVVLFLEQYVCFMKYMIV